MKDLQILAFGHSITYGFWDEEGGWVARLRKYFDKRVIDSGSDQIILVYNLGVSGQTSEDLARRFTKETEERLDPGAETIIIFQIGTNDCLLENSTQILRVPQERFAINIRELINQTQGFTKNILVLESIPVDERKVSPIPWLPAHSYKNDLIKEYNQIKEKICQKEGIEFVSLYGDFEDQPNLLADGCHPNSLGHQKIFEKVKERIEEIVKNL